MTGITKTNAYPIRANLLSGFLDVRVSISTSERRILHLPMPRIRITREDPIRAAVAIALLSTLYLARAHAQDLVAQVHDSAGAPVDNAIVALYGDGTAIAAGTKLEPRGHVVDQVGKRFVPRVGAQHRHDTDFYVSATKLWLAGLFDRNVFANATVRYTRANQIGILGFGGDKDDSRDLMFEGSIGAFLTRHVATGFEYRQQPDNLSFSEQDDWFDAFVGVFPNKYTSIVAAYVDLGTVATLENQNGWYLSFELKF